MKLNILKRTFHLSLFALVAGMLLHPAHARADCSIAIGPNPLPLFSVDFYDAGLGAYIGTTYGHGIITSVSTAPNCVQVGAVGYTDSPLTLGAVTGPIENGGTIFISQYLFGDGGARPGYYPVIAGGVILVAGVDVTTGIPVQAEAGIILTVFCEQL